MWVTENIFSDKKKKNATLRLFQRIEKGLWATEQEDELQIFHSSEVELKHFRRLCVAVACIVGEWRRCWWSGLKPARHATRCFFYLRLTTDSWIFRTNLGLFSTVLWCCSCSKPAFKHTYWNWKTLPGASSWSADAILLRLSKLTEQIQSRGETGSEEQLQL